MKTKYIKHTSSYLGQAALLLFVLLSITVIRADEVADDTQAPYMELSNPEASFPLLSTDVKAEIIDGIVKAKVTQIYMNRGDEPIEAVYLFPLSTRAAVHGMKMKVGERVIVANIEEKKEAEKIYQKAKSEKKVTSLLEQKRPNVFQTKVANILPGDQVQVEIEFTELLQPENLIYEWHFPTVVGPRYSAEAVNNQEREKWVDNPYFETNTEEDREQYTAFNLELTVKSALDIKGFQSPSHNPKIDYLGKREVKLALNSTQAGFQANRDVIIKYKLAEDRIVTGILAHKGEAENFFMIEVQPPERVKPEHIPDREYIFVLDVSGSMKGFPLDTTKELFKNLAKTMKPTDRFNILFFAGGNKLLSPHSLPATADNVKQALKMVDSHRGGGGTNLTSALRRALHLSADQDLARSFVVVTDGYVTAEKDTFELIRKSRNQANVFCFGIGSSVNRHLVEGIAKVGGGEPFIVTKPYNAAKKAKIFEEYISSPVLTNIQLDTIGIELFDVQPASMNDLFANRTLTISGKWKAEKEGSLIIKGKTGDGEDFIQEYTLDPKATNYDNPVLIDLWARQTVRELVDFNKVAEDVDLQARITNLGLKYSMVTPFTSFVAVDQTPQKLEAESKTVHQPLPLPANVSMSATSQAVENGSIPEPSSVFLLALSMIAAMAIRNRKE